MYVEQIYLPRGLFYNCAALKPLSGEQARCGVFLIQARCQLGSQLERHIRISEGGIQKRGLCPRIGLLHTSTLGGGLTGGCMCRQYVIQFFGNSYVKGVFSGNDVHLILVLSHLNLEEQ